MKNNFKVFPQFDVFVDSLGGGVIVEAMTNVRVKGKDGKWYKTPVIQSMTFDGLYKAGPVETGVVINRLITEAYSMMQLGVANPDIVWFKNGIEIPAFELDSDSQEDECDRIARRVHFSKVDYPANSKLKRKLEKLKCKSLYSSK